MKEVVKEKLKLVQAEIKKVELQKKELETVLKNLKEHQSFLSDEYSNYLRIERKELLSEKD